MNHGFGVGFFSIISWHDVRNITINLFQTLSLALV